MAATSKKGKRQKGKTVQLNDFLNTGPSTTSDGKEVVTLKTSSWADEVEDNEDSFPVQTEQVALPRAPRASRQEVDLSQLPDKPPYTLYVGNLSYDADEDALTEFFSNMKLNVHSTRLVRENGRMKGYGYVEFADKQSLVGAFKADGEMLYQRKLKIDLATQSGNRDGGFGGDRGGERSQITGEGDADDDWRTTAQNTPSASYDSSHGRSRDGGFGRRDRDGGFERNRDERDGGGYGPPRDRYGGPSEADSADTWGRAPARSSGNEDRSSGYSSRSNYDDKDGGYNSRRGYNDRDSGYGPPRDRDSGFGPPRDRDYGRRGYDERDFGRRDGRYNSYGSRRGRDYSPPRDSYRHEGYSSSRATHRYDGYNRNGRYDDRGSGYDRQPSSEAPKERPRLNLAPRTKPAESTKPADTGSSPPPSVFGNAKPVDTAAREREIEERLRREQESRPAARDGRDSRDSGSSFGARDIRTNVERRVYNAADDSEQHPEEDEDRSKQNGRHESRPEPVKKPSNASIFGGAKPVDTATKEREIEERLRKEHDVEHKDSAPSDRRYDSRDRQYDSRDRQYDSRDRQYDSRDRQYDSRDRQYDSRDKHHDSRDRQPDSRDRQPDSRDRQPDSRDRQPDSRDRQPDSRDRQPDRDRRYDSRDTRNEAPRTNAWNKGPPVQHSEGSHRKERRERPIPQSIDEMPQYKEAEGRDFSDRNKYAGLLDDED